MRTTLTLEDDVSVRLERIRQRSSRSFKEIVNEALRRGLALMEAPIPERARYRTPSDALGRCLVGSLDDIAEALATAEGDDFR